MWRKDIELILARQLASYLSMPIFLVDSEGNLLFYNEPAEAMLGRRFQETGEMTAHEWSTLFVPTDGQGKPLAPDELPLPMALASKQPVHRDFWIRGLDGISRHLNVTAIPLVGIAGRFLGGMSLFWETPS
jgi:PAS domain-containing protein